MSERRKLDQYFTDQRVADAVVARLLADGWLRPGMSLLEPSAGEGAWIRAASQQMRPASVRAVELDPNDRLRDTLRDVGMSYFLSHMDFLECQFPSRPFDAVLGNPPYARGTGRVRKQKDKTEREVMETIFPKHITKALECVDPYHGVVALMLRSSAYSSRERWQFWKAHQPVARYDIFPRQSFTKGGTDNSEYAVFVWKHGMPASFRPMWGSIWWDGEEPGTVTAEAAQ